MADKMVSADEQWERQLLVARVRRSGHLFLLAPVCNEAAQEAHRKASLSGRKVGEKWGKNNFRIDELG